MRGMVSRQVRAAKRAYVASQLRCAESFRHESSARQFFRVIKSLMPRTPRQPPTVVDAAGEPCLTRQQQASAWH
eukprot:2368468-Prorocentrum_lima.AAC.1